MTKDKAMRVLAAMLALVAGPVLAQLPAAQPQTLDWLSERVEAEVRLKATSGRTAKVYEPTFPNGLNFSGFVREVPCWNKVSACPEVNAVTLKLFMRLPWNLGRVNVTRLVLCGGTECALHVDNGTPEGSPTFRPISAKPGEAYKLTYDRLKGRLTVAVVPVGR